MASGATTYGDAASRLARRHSFVFVQWGVVHPFQPGATDFIGTPDVLPAGAGLLLATVAGGRIGSDGAMHADRIRQRKSRLVA